jgi:hypothetical protein
MNIYFFLFLSVLVEAYEILKICSNVHILFPNFPLGSRYRFCSFYSYITLYYELNIFLVSCSINSDDVFVVFPPANVSIPYYKFFTQNYFNNTYISYITFHFYLASCIFCNNLSSSLKFLFLLSFLPSFFSCFIYSPNFYNNSESK